MSSRQLLTDQERVALFGVPMTRHAHAKLYTLDAADLEFVLTRRTPANRLGFAAAPALLRHPGLAPSAVWPPPEPLVAYLAEQLGIERRAFDDYARRPQTVGDFTLEIATALGLRAPTRADVPFMVEAAARGVADRAGPVDRGRACRQPAPHAAQNPAPLQGGRHQMGTTGYDSSNPHVCPCVARCYPQSGVMQ